MAALPPSAGADAEFVGRGWLVDAVADWAATGSPYLFLTGGPGTGKSATVDHIWGCEPPARTAVHRCRAASRSSCDPVRFSESLAEQFSATLPGFAEALAQVARQRSGRSGELRIEGSVTAGEVHPDASVVGVRVTFSHVTADEAFEALVCRPLELLAPANRPIVVVDGLDEALVYRGRRTIAELVLDGTDRLPLRFVLTSRHDARITTIVRSLPAAVVIDLVDDAPDHAADLVAYARHRLAGMHLAEPERDALARRLAAAGAGNYLYVRYVCQELASGTRQMSGADATDLPHGLEGVYWEFMRREIRPVGSAEAEERWRTDFRPALTLLVAAREDGLTAGRLAVLLKHTEQEVLDVVRVLGQYLRGGGPRGPWLFFHRSFAEFLQAGEDPYVDASEGHRRIVDHAFGEWADDWESCDDAYLLRHLPDHVMTAIESTRGGTRRTRALRDRLHALATSPGYLAAQRAAAPDRDPHLVTLRLALEASLTAHAYARAAGLALAVVRARAEADEVTPVQAALSWGTAAGTARARAYPEDTALLWMLLIVAALGAASPAEAAAVLDEIGSAGFGRTDESWSPAVGALLAPLVPRFTEEEFAHLLAVADDELLGHLAAFLLEDAGPEAAVRPALHIRETIARTRAVTAILTHAALAALTAPSASTAFPSATASSTSAAAGLERLGAAIAGVHLPALARHGWGVADTEVAESAALLYAALGEPEVQLLELAGLSRSFTGPLPPDALLLSRIVRAARLGPAGLAQARAAGEAALAEESLAADPRSILVLLHHTTLMVHAGDPSAPGLLDALVPRIPHDSDGGVHAGHVDAFHGPCDVGLRLAVVRLLAAAGQTDRARREADRLAENDPAEHVRALAWVARTGTGPEHREAQAAAREAADRIPDDLFAPTALVLADSDRGRLAGAVARTAVRAPRDPLIGGPARAALAWAADLRGDHARAAALGAEAVAWYLALPQGRRLRHDADRLVRNLLRARLPAQAATVRRTPTARHERCVLLAVGDVRHTLAAHGEFVELALLQEVEAKAEGGKRPDAAPDSSPYEQTLAFRVLRAGGDPKALEEARATLRTTVRRLLTRLDRQPDPSWIRPHRDELDATWCVLLAARLEWPAALEAAMGLLIAARRQSMSGGIERDVFFARSPREAQTRHELDAVDQRKVQTWSELAEAFHEVGDEDRSGTAFDHARQLAAQVEGPAARALTFRRLAGTAVRLGRYADLPPLLAEVGRVLGASLGELAESLVVIVLRGGEEAAAAHGALKEILASPDLADLDHLDLLAALAVLTPTTEVEELLLSPSPPQR